MSDFSKRLRSEIEYAGLSQKEFAAKAGLKQRALDAYLRETKSMPPADTAVKIAAALGVTVEYLVTGREQQQGIDVSDLLQYRDILDDVKVFTEDSLATLRAVIKTAANIERKRQAGK